MSKPDHKVSHAGLFALILLAAIALALNIAAMIQGKNIALLNPKGLIAQEQFGLMIYVAIVILVIAIPSVALLYLTAWRFRESNTKADFNPDKKRSNWFAAAMWLVPAVFMFILAITLWTAAHRLEPHKAIASDKQPLVVEVIAMRWKWLFIYPEQDIATVNYLQIPTDTPVTFKLTADEAPMSAFWIPNLGGMLYAMTGHENRLNLMATTPGDYPGSSGEINGPGFAGMKFTARASNHEDFATWVQGVKQSEQKLDTATYQALVKPSESHPAEYYASASDELYDTVLMKYIDPSGGGHGHGSGHGAGGHSESTKEGVHH
jgi:cytochrome o ubiquinol oxidase subunit 2